LYNYFSSFKESFENINISSNNMYSNSANMNNMNITYLNKVVENTKTFLNQQLYIIITLFVLLIGLFIVIYKIKK